MFAICIEASHSKGMGHLFRMLNFAKYLKKQNESFIFLINDNVKTKDILISENISFEIVKLDNFTSNWEYKIIEKYNILYWLNDRLETNLNHSQNIKKANIKLINFDDIGGGSTLCDINVAGLYFNKKGLHGKKILKGVDYLILNKEIDIYKRKRNKINNILVTLGGSDTYGVTIQVLELLKRHKIKATIHIGPSFEHMEELNNTINSEYNIINFTPSMIEVFYKYDLAITGGGVTPFEANASGLPCIIIANELFEITNAEYLNALKTSKFIGYYKNINDSVFQNIKNLDIKTMSKNGIKNLNTQAVEKIYREIKNND